MNIEVRRNIKIDSVLEVLKDRSETNPVGKMGKETVVDKQILQDAIQVIEVLVKKNKQLRDINKNLSDKITKRNESIEELTKMCKKLNDQVFELKSKVEEGKFCCQEKESEEYQDYNGNPKKCKEKYESKEENTTEEEMLKELQKILDVIPITTILTMLGIL